MLTEYIEEGAREGGGGRREQSERAFVLIVVADAARTSKRSPLRMLPEDRG